MNSKIRKTPNKKTLSSEKTPLILVYRKDATYVETEMEMAKRLQSDLGELEKFIDLSIKKSTGECPNE